MVKASVNVVLFAGNGSVEFFVDVPVTGINATITDHFIMLFRDMLDKTFYEVHNRKCFFHVSIIFVAVVMEGNKVTVIPVNPGSGNHRTPQVTPDVFDNGFRITFVRLCINVETFFVFPIAEGFYLFKRRPDLSFHFIKQCGAEGITKEGIVKVIDVAPETAVTVTALRNEAMNMGVPF